ncbi:MAG: DNA polymerase I [Gammaproteobacteria bacterium]|nr:MAG: DNA polymerase I [Gammaproteobacteria bacterium]TND02470.1 MAG: DNA polymerase I [Gammaproteobacteria bacterium]
MARSDTKTLVLVDGSSYLYRAFHALPPLTNSRGEPTGAVYGVANMLRKLMVDLAPDYVAVVFDAKGKTFRDDMFEHYKAHRPPMPADLQAQIEPLHELVAALGLPLLMIDGVEADDVIGTLAVRAAAQGIATIVSTGDKDLAQLVNEQVTLINTMTNTTLDRQGVIDKFGVPPERIIDYLALVGDSSDNIPGVPKVGPKTAVKWLQEHGSLDQVVAHAADISGKVGESLRDHLEQLELSRQLATIRCDVSLDADPAQLRPGPLDTAALRGIYQRMEFKRWLEELLAGEGRAVTAPESTAPATRTGRRYQIIVNEDDFNAWLERLAGAELFAFDTETTRLDYMEAEIVGVSFAIEPFEAAYVPVAHDYPGAPQQLSRDYVLERLRPLLEDPRRRKVGQNLKYDKNVLANYAINLTGIAFDTMLESYVIDSNATRHDMDSMALKYLGERTVHFADIAGKGARQLTFNQIDVATAADYAAEDADVTLRLHHALWPRLSEFAGQRTLFETIEVPLIEVLSQMERTGVLVDAGMLNEQSRMLATRILELQHQAENAAGQTFNLASPKQIQEILFDKLGLPVLSKTPKGQPSTAESVLQELALDYDLPKILLEHRALSKLKSTYTDKLPGQVNPRTGRVHTSYHQAVAATGRLSSSDPNLQNIPIRSEEGRRIRQAFVAPAGYRIVAADYSQIELRIMAHLSGDTGLVDAFTRGEDIHRATAAEIFDASRDTVTTEQRRNAKAINFGLIYGMSAFGLARQLGIDRQSAQKYMERYFARYPQVKQFMDNTREQARAQGYVETLFGRRLYLPEIRSSNAQRRQYAERAAINAPMQGTAADIIKCAMLKVHNWLMETGTDAKMIMQVHDELVFEVADTRIDDFVTNIRRHMRDAAALSVPLEVDIGIGNNWDEAH